MMDYAPTKTQLRQERLFRRAGSARKWARFLVVFTVLATGAAYLQDEELGRDMRARISATIEGFDGVRDESSGAGKIAQLALKKLDY